MSVRNSMKEYLSLSSRFNRLSPEIIILFLAIYFAAVLNFPVNKALYQLAGQPAFFITSALMLTGCFIIIFSLILWRFTCKPIMILLIISSATTLYATLEYNVFFDYSMIENIVETHTGEAFSYVNTHAIVFVTVFGVLPCFWLLHLNMLSPHPWYMSLLRRVILICIGVMILAITAIFFYKDYVSIGRNNPYLKKMINPAHVYNAIKYINKRYFTKAPLYRTQGIDAKILPTTNAKPTLLVLVYWC
ncbi:DUF1705 domain-containing protein [uncultured Shewanella sp.]|uniref:DUF1705 domain-containing protein n=1 Tax=uncultured Shewanella sp. TaxID=173975 RepID=UPI00260D31B8|nr:DUF1705 domain-containing protein [uncultured Shewanella sp.]